MRKIGIALLAVCLFTGGDSAHAILWFKKHRRAEREKAIPVSAGDIIAAYNRDENGANALYLDKVLAVTGVIASVELNQSGRETVVFRAEDPMNSVVCNMREKGAAIQAGDSLVILGICTGKPADITLTECVIKQDKDQ